MPLYYFDTHDGETFISDEEGLELEGIDEVRAQAQTALADMLHDGIPASDQRTLFVRVRDEADAVVLKAGLSIIMELGKPGETAERT